MRRAAAALAVVALGVGAPAVARAQGDDTGYIGKERVKLEIDDCAPLPDVDPAQLLAIAREHYERGEVLYSQGDYPGAVSEFVASYCLKPYFTVLEGISVAYERELEYEKVIAYLERYIRVMPDDLKNAAEKRQSVSARIQVLQALKAQVTVATSPSGARITLAGDAGHRAEGRANGDNIAVIAGRYTMTVELPGHEPVTREIDVAIGKPYSFYFKLDRQLGTLRVRAVPGDARIFVDDRLVGAGSYDEQVAGGVYLITVEAPGRLTERRRVEVVAERETPVTVRLAPVPVSGRLQLILAAGVAGGIGGASIGHAFDDRDEVAVVGGLAGTAIGLLSARFGAPRDISTGSSSYITTVALVGYVEGFGATDIIANDDQADSAIGVATLLGGATFAAATADRFSLSEGDAALLNSGALWGGISGGLFAAAFGLPKRIESGIVLGGLNLGVVAGALLGRTYDVSRRHMALIDLAALSGMAISVSVERAIDATSGKERVAHFALGGMTLGLIGGAYLTQSMDLPKTARLQPSVTSLTDGHGRSVLGLALGGAW